jgi:hypothetical protein
MKNQKSVEQKNNQVHIYKRMNKVNMTKFIMKDHNPKIKSILNKMTFLEQKNRTQLTVSRQTKLKYTKNLRKRLEQNF